MMSNLRWLPAIAGRRPGCRRLPETAVPRRPSGRAASGSSALPRTTARSVREPSGDATTPVSTSAAPSSTACAPTGIWHPPPSARTMDCSAASAVPASASARACGRVTSLGIGRANLDRDDALARRRHAGTGVHGARDAVRALEPRQSSRRPAPAHRAPRRRVSAAVCRGCRARARRLRRERDGAAAPRVARCSCRCAASPRAGASRLRGRPAGAAWWPGQHDRVAGILARQRRGQCQAFGRHGRHVLAAVHGQRPRRPPAARPRISFTNRRLPPIASERAEASVSATRSPSVLMTTTVQSTPARSRSRRATVLA